MNWTKGQQQAIESSSGDITVAASAGTGKTTVLSQRAVRILGAQELCPDVSDILVLTFTDAAAGEMRQRIAQNLKDAAQKSKNIHLRKQLLMLDSADISTIHSFCKRIIGQHFHRLGLDPAFRVMDADESELIKREILARVTEDAWNDMPEGMQQLLNGRPVSNPKTNFLNCIVSISDFLDTVVSRQEWFDRAGVFNDAVVAAASDAFKNQKQDILGKLKNIKQRFEWSLKLDEKITNGHWAEQIQSECFGPVVLAIDFLEKDDLPSFIEVLNSFEGFKWNNKPKTCSSELREFVLGAAIKAIKDFKYLPTLAILNPEYQRLVAGGCSVQTKVLVELVKRFDSAYKTAKQQLGSVDFSDLERYMLALLCENGDVDSGTASDIALHLQKKYKYIFVDEYQDINPVQQKIIDMLCGSAKVFVVGDVKQSIYAWRGADCGLFVKRLSSSGGDETKSRVDLNENFRSRPGILNFVNEIFSRIMTESVAAIDYDQNAALKPFKTSQDLGRPDVEMMVVDEDSQADDDDENEKDESGISSEAINCRALTVANRIKELIEVEKFQVFDKSLNAYRPCRYSDIVILTRAFAQRASNYVQVLRLANIPVVSDSSAGYFATTEITDMLSLLQVLDNPRQDIPLAAVLRSPLFGVTEAQLAETKTQNKEKEDFYSAIESCASQNPAGKIADVLRTLDNWRTLARQSSLADLIWRIYTQTDYPAFVSALPGGSQRRSNLLKLHQRAIQFENFTSSFNVVSLSRFVDFLQKLLDAGGDWAPAEPDSCAANAVRVMSIHKSKGLEFPIVFLVETNRRFQGGGHSSDCITDASNTIGLKIIENASKLSSLTWQLIRERQRKQTLSEEMRILYVALTRAKDKLIISGAAKNEKCVQLISNGGLCDGEKLPDWLIEDAVNELDWIMLALASYKKLQSSFELPVEIDSKDGNLFDLKIFSSQEISQLANQMFKKHSASRYETIKIPAADNSLLGKIEQRLNWNYPFVDFAGIKAKQSVTSIAHGDLEYAESDCNYLFESFDKSANSSGGLVIGSATHLVIKNIELTDGVNVNTINQTIESLVSSKYITKEIAGKINSRSVLDFFNSELGKLVRDGKNKIMREWPFTYAASVWELYPEMKNYQDEKIIVQGIIDMLVQTPDGAVIIDFKTDRVKPEDIQQRAEKYVSQIKWYCKAAGKILGLEKVEGHLYFLNANKSFKAF
ncbi:MAG: helicase-exonuclease AddAB subunit AddA [Planctomycetaceae bacterium]|nr:helicase-exonuclease AddAB subunit AddA [Planctomycetaceae bacterium]